MRNKTLAAALAVDKPACTPYQRGFNDACDAIYYCPWWRKDCDERTAYNTGHEDGRKAKRVTA